MQPLAGMTVADLTRYLPGPFASRELLRLGARVVKIEPPDGDPVRATSYGAYEALNAGKEIVSWDARSEPPPAVLQEADIVLEGFRPGVWERLGIELPRAHDPLLDHRFRRHRPDGRARRATTSTISATRACSRIRHPRCRPCRSPTSPAGAQAAVIEILAALLERARTGTGRAARRLDDARVASARRPPARRERRFRAC